MVRLEADWTNRGKPKCKYLLKGGLGYEEFKESD